VKVVHRCHDEPNVVDLNFMWLPTFIGQNVVMLKELKKEIELEFKGQLLTEETLWAMHHAVIRWLEAKFPFEGISKYLHAIEEIKDEQ
jgi:hypothetical protein